MSRHGESVEEDIFDPIREHEEGVRELAQRSDRIGATARVLLALANDKHPSETDLKTAGFIRETPTDAAAW